MPFLWLYCKINHTLKVICPIVVSPVALMIKPSHLLSVSFLVPIHKVQLIFRSINTDFSFILFYSLRYGRELTLFIDENGSGRSFVRLQCKSD
jgi:hypothetical protein